MNIIDCRGMLCPRPVLETRKQLLAHPDSELTVLVSNDIAQANVSRLATKEGFSVQVTISGTDITLLLTPMAQENEPAKETAPTTQISGNTIVYIASNCMGKGSDELGEVLMRNFIFTLAQCQERPSTIMFVNSGVKLTCSDSTVLEPLQFLADAGVTICSCGLCLEFFGLQQQLKIGQASNMLETVEVMQQAGRIIQP